MNSNGHEIPVAIDQGQVAMAIAKAIGSSTVSLSRSQVAQALWHLAVEENGGQFDDDAGLDWYTDDAGNCYANANWAWQMSSNPNVAAIVDAVNIIHYGAPNKMAGEKPADMANYDPDQGHPPPNLWIRHERLGILSVLPLNVMDERIEIELETSTGERVKIWINVSSSVVYLGVDGYGDKCSYDESGHVLALVVDQAEGGKPEARVAVWNDINVEDPRFIRLDKARLEKREEQEEE